MVVPNQLKSIEVEIILFIVVLSRVEDDEIVLLDLDYFAKLEEPAPVVLLEIKDTGAVISVPDSNFLTILSGDV